MSIGSVATSLGMDARPLRHINRDMTKVEPADNASDANRLRCARLVKGFVR
jgi:hypothetical protein